jgi:hypothetical protein
MKDLIESRRDNFVVGLGGGVGVGGKETLWLL